MYAYERDLPPVPHLDIDFLGTHISNDGERIVEAFREICAVDCKEDGVYSLLGDKIEPPEHHRVQGLSWYPSEYSSDNGLYRASAHDGHWIWGCSDTASCFHWTTPVVRGLPEASILAYSTETVIAGRCTIMIWRQTKVAV